MFVSMGAWFGPKFPPLLVFLDLVAWYHMKVVAFQSWTVTLHVLTQCHCIKVTALYSFEAPVCMVCAPLAHKDCSFCDLGQLDMPNWSVIIFEAWAYFQLLRAHDRYKALTILRLSPQKMQALINFLDYLAFCTLTLLLFDLSLTFWCLLCLANIYKHVWLSLCSFACI